MNLQHLFESTTFVAHARRENCVFFEDLNRDLALKRDLNIMLYWTAISGEQKQEHVSNMIKHFSENSVADLSLQMSYPKLNRNRSDKRTQKKYFFWKTDRSEFDRLDNIEVQLSQINEAIEKITNKTP